MHKNPTQHYLKVLTDRRGFVVQVFLPIVPYVPLIYFFMVRFRTFPVDVRIRTTRSKT